MRPRRTSCCLLCRNPPTVSCSRPQTGSAGLKNQERWSGGSQVQEFVLGGEAVHAGARLAHHHHQAPSVLPPHVGCFRHVLGPETARRLGCQRRDPNSKSPLHAARHGAGGEGKLVGGNVQDEADAAQEDQLHPRDEHVPGTVRRGEGLPSELSPPLGPFYNYNFKILVRIEPGGPWALQFFPPPAQDHPLAQSNHPPGWPSGEFPTRLGRGWRVLGLAAGKPTGTDTYQLVAVQVRQGGSRLLRASRRGEGLLPSPPCQPDASRRTWISGWRRRRRGGEPTGVHVEHSKRWISATEESGGQEIFSGCKLSM